MTHINISLIAPNCIGPDEHTLDDAVRIALQQAPVHVSTGVAFVGVADNVSGSVF